MIDSTEQLEEMMRSNLIRCCQLTDSIFAMKFALYTSLFPHLNDTQLWEKIIEDILKRKNAYGKSHTFT